MAKSSGMSWAEIETHLEKYAKRVLSAAAGKIRDDLYKEAETAIADFYASYDPIYYRRHYYNFEKNNFKKYYSNKHNSLVYRRVELTPQSLDAIYQDGVQEVFDTVFEGFHGPAGMFYTPKTFSVIPPRMIPSPRQRLLNMRKRIMDSPEKYIEFGKKVARQENSLLKK